ncbi:MAG: hypothetical protein HOO96_35395 [Polyangiaceae bacterium]|nr:hypothetical protein [Polyangiaceae bacterium]
MRLAASSLLLAALTVAMLSHASTARADAGSDRLLAQGLFDEGLKLMDAGRYPEACPKFVESQRLDPGGGTLLNIALCHEKEGRLATATLDYDEAIAQAVKDKRSDRETFARTRLQQIAPLVPHIAVTLGKGVPEGASVRIDDTPVPPAALGVPLPFNAGKHVVTATAPGRGTFKQEVLVRDGDLRRLDIPGLPPGDGSPSVAPPPANPAPALGGSTYDRKGTSPVVPALWITGGVAFAASLVTGTWALVSWATYKADCVDGRAFCRTQDGKDAADTARTMAIASTITLGVGAVAWLAIPFIPNTHTTVRAGLTHVSVEGSF